MELATDNDLTPLKFSIIKRNKSSQGVQYERFTVKMDCPNELKMAFKPKWVTIEYLKLPYKKEVHKNHSGLIH